MTVPSPSWTPPALPLIALEADTVLFQTQLVSTSSYPLLASKSKGFLLGQDGILFICIFFQFIQWSLEHFNDSTDTCWMVHPLLILCFHLPHQVLTHSCHLRLELSWQLGSSHACVLLFFSANTLHALQSQEWSWDTSLKKTSKWLNEWMDIYLSDHYNYFGNRYMNQT